MDPDFFSSGLFLFHPAIGHHGAAWDRRDHRHDIAD